MMKFITTLFAIVIFTAALVFAVSNRQDVSVSLWPFDLMVTMPIFIMSLGCLALGMLFGGIFVWIGTLSHRLAARRLGKDIALLSDKLQEVERELQQFRAREVEKTMPLLGNMLEGKTWRFWERFKRDR